MIVAGESAEFGLPEIDLGILPGGGGIQRLARIAGPNKAKEFVTTGRPMDAEEAEGLGVVNRVVPDDELSDAVRDLVEEIPSKPPLSVRHGKRVIDGGLEASLQTGLSLEQQAVSQLKESDDASVGFAAFLEDRATEFQSR